MACCAFAAFLISQIILAFDRARAALGFSAPQVDAPNANALWRLGEIAPVSSKASWRPALAFTALASMLGAAAGLVLGGADGSGHMFAFDIICTLDGAVTIAGLNR